MEILKIAHLIRKFRKVYVAWYFNQGDPEKGRQLERIERKVRKNVRSIANRDIRDRLTNMVSFALESAIKAEMKLKSN